MIELCSVEEMTDPFLRVFFVRLEIQQRGCKKSNRRGHLNENGGNSIAAYRLGQELSIVADDKCQYSSDFGIMSDAKNDHGTSWPYDE